MCLRGHRAAHRLRRTRQRGLSAPDTKRTALRRAEELGFIHPDSADDTDNEGDRN